MSETFFPIIDIQQYQKEDRNEDLEVLKIKEELITEIVDVLVVLQSILRKSSEQPKINEPQKIVLCGLKFNCRNSRELPVQIAKLYQILGLMQDKKTKLENLDSQNAGLSGNKVLEIAKGIQELVLLYDKHMEDEKKMNEEESPHMDFDAMVEMFKKSSLD